MAGGHVWWGVDICARGHVWWGGTCMAGKTATAVGGTYLTGMHYAIMKWVLYPIVLAMAMDKMGLMETSEGIHIAVTQAGNYW